jgi:hypothetical protein
MSKRTPLGAIQRGRNVIIMIDGKKFTKKTEDNKEVETIKRKIDIYNKAKTDALATKALEDIKEIFKPKSEKENERAKTEARGLKNVISKEKAEIEKGEIKANKTQKTHRDKLLKKASANSKKNKVQDFSNYLVVTKTGNFVLKGCENVPMPELLVKRLEEFIEKGQDIKPLINFWSLALLNPNHVARTKLFDYLERNGLTITPNGYFVTYRMVKRTDELGVFTDARTSKMKYHVGEVARIPREECDEDGANDCSRGLHTGTPKFIGIIAEKKYNLDEAKGGVGDGYGIKRVTTKAETSDSYGTGYDRPKKESSQVFNSSFGNQAIITLINPQHVVSIPDSDTRKMRSCEFYFCKLTTPEEVIDMVEKDYLLFDYDYQAVELKEIQEMLKDRDVKNYIKAKEGTPMSKLFKLEEKLAEKKSTIKMSGDKIAGDLDLNNIRLIIQQRLVTVTTKKK